jgi:hypothetical protein
MGRVRSEEFEPAWMAEGMKHSEKVVTHTSSTHSKGVISQVV